MLSNFPTEELKLLKKNGSVVDPVVGLVSRGGITTEDVSVQIEEGDVFERTISNGLIERYLVTDSGFKKGMGGHIPDHYQVKVEKITDLPKSDNQRYIHVTNEGGNVNINSTDHSIRIVVNDNYDKLFSELRNALTQIGSIDDQLINLVDEMESSIEDKAVFAKKYSQFIASAADHMAIITPFLPALATILT